MFYKPRNSIQSTTVVDESKPHEIVLGGYKIRKDKGLGMGSYSKVYLCEDKSGKKAAVKILSKNGNRNNQIIRITKIEAMTLKTFNHPLLPKYIGSFESQNNFYLLFSFHEGQTLRDLLKLNSRLEMKDVSKIVVNLLSIFSYLHEKRIMHRDLKPDNILYNFKKATLIDFGFACEMPKGEKTILKDWIGTPAYMSPEMLQKKNYTWKSDIWSFGVLIYELIYGILPWKGNTEKQLLSKIFKQELKFPQDVEVSNQFIVLIKQCLQIDYERRVGWKTLFRYQSTFLHEKNVIHDYEENIHFCYCSLFCG